MDEDEIKSLICEHIPDAEVSVSGDGYHFEALVVSNQFQDKSLLARQRMVYAALGDAISDGSLHALSIKARTPDE